MLCCQWALGVLHRETELNVIVIYIYIYIFMYNYINVLFFLDRSLTLVGGVYPSTKKEIL